MVEPTGSARLISPVDLREARACGKRMSSSDRNWSISSPGTGVACGSWTRSNDAELNKDVAENHEVTARAKDGEDGEAVSSSSLSLSSPGSSRTATDIRSPFCLNA